MACGCPVVALDTPVNREIGGDTARYHADDPRAAADAIREVLASPPEKARLVAHARAFTWARAARQTAAVYARVREGRR
jgi:glycosyltransferase involved in cell wall biosynthesis